jgi:uncharacterized protein (TIGR00269 family)
MKCTRCHTCAAVALPSHHAAFCPECFLLFCRRMVERAIHDHHMFSSHERILVALSGGKDSLSLAWILRDLGYSVSGLHIDLGIPDSSHHARRITEEFCSRHAIPLHVLEMEPMGLGMAQVRRRIRRPICSVCGQTKRYFFNRFALEHGFSALATGHNLDDETSRLLANILRWDTAFLADQGPVLPAQPGFVRKVKPIYRLTEFETANLSFLLGIETASAPCPYSAKASFPIYKNLLAELEEKQPGRKLQFYEGFLKTGRIHFPKDSEATLQPCPECGSPTSAPLCGVCRLRTVMASAEDR